MNSYQRMLQSVENANKWKEKRYAWAVSEIVKAAQQMSDQDLQEFYQDLLGGGDDIVNAVCRRLSRELKQRDHVDQLRILRDDQGNTEQA